MFHPKISLLMLALLPQFVAPTAGRPEAQIAIMVAMHAVIAGIVHTQIVLFSGVIAACLKILRKVQRIVL
jgi:threonine/homoserine/homoserine lactone efflux protein